MRDALLLSAIAISLGFTLRYPFVGIITWTWLTVQNPHQDTYGIAQSTPLNLIVAIISIISILLSSERTLPKINSITIAIFLFFIWTTVNLFFSFSYDWSIDYWDLTWKTILLGFIVSAVADNKVRINTIILTIVGSLFYYGIKGGIFTISTGGQYHVLGPPGTIIGDNNQLALALLMALPLANYLRQQVRHVAVSRGIAFTMALTLISVIGSYSRGALIGLGALTIVSAFRSRQKLLFASLTLVAVVVILAIMPASFWNRAESIQNAGEDTSFVGRTIAWQVALHYAIEHFPFGAGFYALQHSEIFNTYFPGIHPLAAHSIYFQVLGEQGFVGLGIYLTILVLAFLKSQRIIRATQYNNNLLWMHDMAQAIQTSLIVFCVAGAALSMAYYDVMVILIFTVSSLDDMASKITRLP